MVSNLPGSPGDNQPTERFGGDTRITPAMEDYLKAIYRIEQDGHPVTTQRLADDLALTGASVTNMMKRLDELKLLVHNPYRGVALTDTGIQVALEVIRHHRLLELFLAEALGFGIDKVHQEADRLEHHVSEEFEARMEKALGYPEFDPHGDPIPHRNGSLPTIADVALPDMRDATSGVVSRVSDRHPEHLRHVDNLGIRPGVHLTMIEHDDAGAVIHVRLASGDETIPVHIAAGIRMIADEPVVTS
jgi:DtxR family transcriptional regulator, Mn-dependent transcriptional regulator